MPVIPHLSTTPPPVGQLNSITKVRKELSKIYKETRQGGLGPQTATRLASILMNIACLIRDSDLETRISNLEKNIQHQTGGTHGEP